MIGMTLSPSWGNIPTPSRFLKVYKRIQVPLRSPKVLRATFSVAPQHGLPHGEVEFDDVVKHYRTPLQTERFYGIRGSFLRMVSGRFSFDRVHKVVAHGDPTCAGIL